MLFWVAANCHLILPIEKNVYLHQKPVLFADYEKGPFACFALRVFDGAPYSHRAECVYSHIQIIVRT